MGIHQGIPNHGESHATAKQGLSTRLWRSSRAIRVPDFEFRIQILFFSVRAACALFGSGFKALDLGSKVP